MIPCHAVVKRISNEPDGCLKLGQELLVSGDTVHKPIIKDLPAVVLDAIAPEVRLDEDGLVVTRCAS
jgi:hypothetical protein